MTRASDLARLIGAGATINDGTTITTADNDPQLTLTSTDADASSGPNILLKRDSASPADNDTVGRVKFVFDNDAGEETEAVRIDAFIPDVSDGTEDATFQELTMVGGTMRSRVEHSSTETVFNQDSQDIDFRVESNNNANMLVVDAGNDRVGIGEASPDTPLHITYAKDVAYSVDNFTQEANVALKIENTSSTANAFSSMQFRVGSGADLFFGIEQKSANDGDFVFGNQNSTDVEMARITNRPCLVVGASTDTDARIYGSRGDAGDTAMFESTSSASSGVIAIRTSIGQNNNNTNSHHLFAITQNVASFKLHGNGSSTFSSDERLKKNIETTRDGYLEDLAKLRVVKYNWHCDDDSTDKELGLIAQEVQKVFPKLVVEDDVELNGIEKPLALKVSVLPMMLLKALQEANTKITALEARITALESK
tara:strand:+ start:2326 stop:3600 length:1275 start_codon:yes stop_codon:yes gene_type:complete